MTWLKIHGVLWLDTYVFLPVSYNLSSSFDICMHLGPGVHCSYGLANWSRSRSLFNDHYKPPDRQDVERNLSETVVALRFNISSTFCLPTWSRIEPSCRFCIRKVLSGFREGPTTYWPLEPTIRHPIPRRWGTVTFFHAIAYLTDFWLGVVQGKLPSSALHNALERRLFYVQCSVNLTGYDSKHTCRISNDLNLGNGPAPVFA